MASFRCSDLGLDCPYEATAGTAGEMPRIIIDHVHTNHCIGACSADLLMRIRDLINRDFR